MAIYIDGIIKEGIFLVRENRFKARVLIDGKVLDVHVPNTGRMTELLKKGARVIVRKSNINGRKTEWDLLMVYKSNVLTCIDSRLPNDLIYNEIKFRKINELTDFKVLQREVQYKNSRFDMYLANESYKCFIEIKCVTLFENRIARFPDAPTGRGRKHLEELIDASINGFRSVVVFVVFSGDVIYFRPNDEMDPEFGKLLRKAYLHGVSIHAYSCNITPGKLELKKRLFVLI